MWKNDQEFEKNWWGNCCNTFQEETKQLVYASKMGLKSEMIEGKFPVYNLNGASVLDIGGGPVSMLIKCVNIGFGMVVDPCSYPEWVEKRYSCAGIGYVRMAGEDFTTSDMVYDQCWCYNVLQHVKSPETIINNMKKVSKIIRLFEWIDNGVSEGHPQDLHENELNEWLGGEGKVELLNENGCRGKCFYGIFKGDFYDNS